MTGRSRFGDSVAADKKGSDCEVDRVAAEVDRVAAEVNRVAAEVDRVAADTESEIAGETVAAEVGVDLAVELRQTRSQRFEVEVEVARSAGARIRRLVNAGSH